MTTAYNRVTSPQDPLVLVKIRIPKKRNVLRKKNRAAGMMQYFDKSKSV